MKTFAAVVVLLAGSAMAVPTEASASLGDCYGPCSPKWHRCAPRWVGLQIARPFRHVESSADWILFVLLDPH